MLPRSSISNGSPLMVAEDLNRDLMQVIDRIISLSEKRLADEALLRFADKPHIGEIESHPLSGFESRPHVKVLLIVEGWDVVKEIRVRLEHVLCADFEVVADAANGLDGVRLAQELTPDIVVVDLLTPGIDGLGATEELSANVPEAKVVALAAIYDELVVHAFLDAGAIGVFPKADIRHMVRFLKFTFCKRDASTS